MCEAFRIKGGVVWEFQVGFAPGVEESDLQIGVDHHQPSIVERPTAAPAADLRDANVVEPLLGETIEFDFFFLLLRNWEASSAMEVQCTSLYSTFLKGRAMIGKPISSGHHQSMYIS